MTVSSKGGKNRRVVALRRVSQAGFLALFIVFIFLTENTGENKLALPVRVFLDFDPLNAVVSFLAAHSLPEKFFLAAITLTVTFLLGRVFCGWVCPLGTLNQLMHHSRQRTDFKGYDWRRMKYLLLAGLGTAALFGLNLTGLFDPLSLAIRSMSLAVLPAFNQILIFSFDLLAHTSVSRWSERVYYFLREHHVIAFVTPRFHQAQLIAGVFAAVLLLNLARKRFFCRYVCPLGALLGLSSVRCCTRLTVDEQACISCGLCNKVCPSSADPFPPGAWKRTECFVCYNCVKVCPVECISIEAALGQGAKTPQARVHLGRRRLLAAAAAGAVAAPVTRVLPAAARPRPNVIRPPGSREELEFLRTCVRCGECMKVCIANGLQPALFEAGLEGLWTPVFDMRRGYCEYSCTLCGQVCPTQAIRELDVSVKRRVRIGLAFFDVNRCLPHAFGLNCIVCEEHCPTPVKAIWFEKKAVTDRKGSTREIKLPHVDPEICIGCGICETKCPVTDKPAIRVTSINESRSDRSKLLL